MNRVAASLAPRDTDDALRDLERLASRIGLAEIRLDLMQTFDIGRLVAGSPVPLILTCRPERERGGYQGPEPERLAILRAAYESGCAYVDVEADSLDAVSGWHGRPARIVASQHWSDRMPDDLRTRYLELRDRCAVVKLVGTAHEAEDVLPVLRLLREASTPVIGMAMGGPGICTRIIAPAFRHTLLTYGAATKTSQTAPGQITVAEMTGRYALHLVTPDTKVHLHVVGTQAQYRAVQDTQDRAPRGAELHVPLQATQALARRLAEALPEISVEA